MVGVKRKDQLDSSNGNIVEKKAKKNVTEFEDTVEKYFSDNLLTEESIEKFSKFESKSEPYKYCVIDNLVNDELLRNVRSEIIKELHFTPKETDIYKVHQTGDLANLSGLPADELSQLPSLLKLRNAIYSRKFRDFISRITHTGPLSGSQTDMSINVYVKGSHLLNHDDVIGTRRVSYILYLTDPEEKWDPSWGGALRLYPTLADGVPGNDFVKSIPPAWNQLSFFRVQPGRSFHDVEEVYKDNKPRMAISGWFHAPQKGEEGYSPTIEEISSKNEYTKDYSDKRTGGRSTLSQLESNSSDEYDRPFKNRVPIDPSNLELESIEVPQNEIQSRFGFANPPESAENAASSSKDSKKDNPIGIINILPRKDKDFLKKYISPELIEDKGSLALAAKFLSDSSLEIRNFLNDEFAAKIKASLEANEKDAPPQHSDDVKEPWKVAGAPHKAKYLYLDTEFTCDPSQNVNKIDKKGKGKEIDETKEDIEPTLLGVSKLLAHPSFSRWIHLVSSCALLDKFVLARRFRPGIDYTLATLSVADATNGEKMTIEGTLDLTPTVGWEDGEHGGYEIVMAVDETDSSSDPAVYVDPEMKKFEFLSNKKTNKLEKDEEENTSKVEGKNEEAKENTSKVEGKNEEAKENKNKEEEEDEIVELGEEDGNEEEDDDDDNGGVLMSSQADWNVLTLFLRDKGLLKFVKYVNKSAPGSRWDITAEWEVEGNDESDDEDEDEKLNGNEKNKH